MVKWSLNDILLASANSIVFLASLVGLIASFWSHVDVHITPGPGYIGPTEYDLVGVPPQFFLIVAIGSALTLIGVFVSSMKLSARVFIGIGNLLILSHSVIGVLVYYEVIKFFWWIFERGLFHNQPIIYINTGFLVITMLFGLLTLIIGEWDKIFGNGLISQERRNRNQR